MKYWIALFVSVLFLVSCDDGDKIEVSFDFAAATVQKCTTGSVLFKISDNEALILNTSEVNFPNAEGIKNIDIDAGTTVVYKKYERTTNASNICATPTLSVLEEWNAVGGTLEIVTTKVLNSTNSSEIIAYNHKITFKNITFSAPNKQVVFDTYDFGNYKTNVVDLKFDYGTAITQKCTINNLIFKYNSTNALLLDVNQATLFNTTLGVKEFPISATNKVVYRVYNGGLNTNYFCGSLPPAVPNLTEEWVAENGVTSVSGIIKVETTQPNATTYKHTIKLYNTTFKKGIQTYSPAPNADYLFGEFTTN